VPNSLCNSYHVSLGKFVEAFDDYSTSLQQQQVIYNLLEKTQTAPPAELQQAHSSIQELNSDIERVRLLRDTNVLKVEADKRFASNQLSEALECYEKALCLLPMHVGCLSNRAALHLACGRIDSCIDDCTAALQIMELDVANAAVAGPMKASTGNVNAQLLSSILPAVGTEKRKLWVVKTVTRRGAAYAQLNKLDLAVEDYALAAKLDPSNEKLQADYKQISALVSRQKEAVSTSSEAAGEAISG
jgi:tetratricopeptide (TPR) repeat protein